MSWVYLIISIIFEIAGDVYLKLSDGMTRLVPTTLMLAFYLISLAALSLALKKIDMSIAYAMWGGMGIGGTTLIGIWWFAEPASTFKLLCIGAIIFGIVGLSLTESS